MNVLGIMSGTSMDGIDLALCSVDQNGENWNVNILKAITLPYNETWRVRLSQLKYQNPELYARTDVFYGRYLGELALAFQKESGLEIDLIASHGHTIFHQPQKWITAQVGDGATLYGTSGIPTVSNFRRADVAAGGQGAPLVTLGDELLFSEYDACLNLGGFCNVSLKTDSGRLSFDIAPCNIVLNRLARERKLKFDEGGKIAEPGNIIYPLLEQLNSIGYYKKSAPKSLGREWINKEFWHLVRDFDDHSLEDRMKTLVDHIGQQIGENIEQLAEDSSTARVYVTGGGAFNPTLVDHLRTHTDAEIIVPDAQVIEYKEALIFGLLAVLRVQNKTNILKSYTGAENDSVSGELAGNFSHLV